MDEQTQKTKQLLARLAKQSSKTQNFVLPNRETPVTTANESFFDEIKKEATSADLAESELLKIQEKAKARGFSFLLVGRAGVGKSSTINSLMGREIAPVGEFEAETKIVKAYPAPSNAIIPYRIYDTPGLCDADGDNEAYLRLIHTEIKEPIDCLWFVTQLDEPRVRTDEIVTIRHTTSAFGKEIWKRAVIVFTRADKVEPKDFERYLYERTRLIRDQIAKEVGQEIALEIPSVAITNKGTRTPDRKLWLGRLFVKTFVRISEEGLDGFLLEIVNWRGLRLQEDDETQESQSSSQDIHTHFYYRTTYENNTYVNNNVSKVSNAPLGINGDMINEEPRFPRTVENWFQKVGRSIGEEVGDGVGRIVPVPGARELGRAIGGAIGAETATVIQDGARQIAESVSNTIEQGGNLVRNVWNNLTSIFR
jgi:GTP-binding protein EngB required for normal cell division